MMGMKRRRPELEVDLAMGSNRDLLNMLEDNTLDAILIVTSDNEFSKSKFDIVPLFEGDIFLALCSSKKWM
ncbi:hypothetical protein [Serratia marcescens]